MFLKTRFRKHFVASTIRKHDQYDICSFAATRLCVHIKNYRSSAWCCVVPNQVQLLGGLLPGVCMSSCVDAGRSFFASTTVPISTMILLHA